MTYCASVCERKFENPPKSISELYCGLIIMIELADLYCHCGCTLLSIAEKYHIPVTVLDSVAGKLKGIGLITAGEDNHLSLKEEPRAFWIMDILNILKQTFK